MARDPVLDLQPVHETVDHLQGHDGAARLVELGLAFDAVQESLRSVAPVAGAEVVEPRALHGLALECVDVEGRSHGKPIIVRGRSGCGFQVLSNDPGVTRSVWKQGYGRSFRIAPPLVPI